MTPLCLHRVALPIFMGKVELSGSRPGLMSSLWIWTTVRFCPWRGRFCRNSQGTTGLQRRDTSYETDTIRYNFKSKRVLSTNVVSQPGEGYVTGNNAKKGNNDELYMKSGRYHDL